MVHKITSFLGFSIPYQKNNKYNYIDKDNLNSIDVFWCWKNLVSILRKYLEPYVKNKTDRKSLKLQKELDKMFKSKNKKLKEIFKEKLPDLYIQMNKNKQKVQCPVFYDIGGGGGLQKNNTIQYKLYGL